MRRLARVAPSVLLWLSSCSFSDGAGVDRPRVVESEPAAGATNVALDATLRVRFDRTMSVRSLNRGTVRLRSGIVDEALSLRYEPTRRELVAVSFDGAPLAANVQYRLRLDGIFDVAGVEPNSVIEIPFRTGTRAVGTPGPAPVGWADVSELFLERCSSASCHGDAAAAGIRLDSGDAVRATAIGRARRPTAGGAVGAGTFGLTGLPVIDVVGGVGRPGTSYLLYLVIDDPAIDGQAMPPATELTAGGLAADEALRLSEWIRAGAPTR